MIDLVVDACRDAGFDRPIAVLNPAQPEVAEHLAGRCEVVFQQQPRGTGHALSMVPGQFLKGDVLVINADAALIRPETIRALIERHRASSAQVPIASTVDPNRPDGRILRDDDGGFRKIVEDKDASPEERQVAEINVGLYCFPSEDLQGAPSGLKPENKAGEISLTDAVTRLRPVEIFEIADSDEALGINDRVELARAESVLRHRILNRLMLSGVTIRDPVNTWISAEVEIGQDTIVEPFTIISGAT